MKVFKKYFTTIGLLIFSAQLIAGPGLAVTTINTKDAVTYTKWLTESTPKFMEVYGETVASTGICSPISGAEQEGDHYAWAISPSMSALLQSEVRFWNDKSIAKTINKISSKRNIVRKDIYEIIKPAKRAYKVGETTAQYNLLSRPNNVAEYVKTIEAMEAAAAKNGFEDIQMVVFEAFGAGDWARMVMASIQAPNVERLGAFFDQNRSDWMAESMNAFPSMRTPVRDWYLLCTTLSAVN